MYSDDLLSFDLPSPDTCSTAVDNTSTPSLSPGATANTRTSNTITSIPQITRVVVNAPSAPLTFHTEHVDLFFQRFESRYRHAGVEDFELCDRLLQCLNYSQQSRMQRVLSDTYSYKSLKQALLSTYGKTVEEAQENLSYAPELGNRLPSEMLAQLRNILGRHLKEHTYLEHLLRREWMTRLPVFVRDHLLLLDPSDLDIMAEKADKLVNDRKRRYQHQDLSSPQSQNISSHALQDIVKRLSEVVAIQEKAANAQLQSLSSASTASAYTSSHTTHSHMPTPTTFTYTQPFRASTYAQMPASNTHTQPRSANTRHQPSTVSSIHSQSFVPSICWYHQNFGSNARRCAPGCKFYTNAQNVPQPPLNSRGGASLRFQKTPLQQ